MSELWAELKRHPADAVAFSDGTRRVSFGDLTSRPLLAGSGPVDVIGDSSLSALLDILDAWRVNRPVVLLHPRASEADHRAVTAEVRSAPLPAQCRAVVATSGSTGSRKYVLLSETNLLASVRASAANLPLGREDAWWMAMPSAHVGGLAILVRCLVAGATVRSSPRFSAAAFEEALSDGITVASLVPTMLRTLLGATQREQLPGSLRAILIGGGPCTPALARSARSAGFPILLTWGMSEAGSQIATQSGSASFSLAEQDLATVGTLLPGFELRQVSGIAHVRGDSITMGYHPPGAAPSAIDADGWLNTRDRIQEMPNGHLRIIGRGTDLIISGGENVYPAEVEAVLESLPFVRAACVVGLPDEKWGERVHAAIAWTDGPASEAALAAVREELGALKCPRRIQSVEELPVNVNGKVDRGAVRQLCLSTSTV